VRDTIDFIATLKLDYPKYDEWVQRVEAELFSGYKSAALAYSEGILVGDVIWQPHKQITRMREIKNLRILPLARRRGLARFLLKQVECDCSVDFDILVSDIREGQDETLSFFRDAGYSVVGRSNLYESERQEIVVAKRLKDFI
jgi:GNAT superfamily N-acetyltransferase